jgi:cytochrome oxidase assembly protein ShyY1
VLREPFWVRAALFAALLAAACVLLGRWQWGRHEARVARADLIQRNYDAPPVPVATVLPDPAAPLPADSEWRQVRLQGSYLADRTVLVRNRPLDKTYGYAVVVPFRPTDGGAVLLVDRGWIPNGASGARPDAVPAPPGGQVTVVARLRPTEPALGRSAPAGQQQSIDVPGITATLGTPAVARAYGVLAAEVPAPSAAPRALARPDGDLGSHLAYAVQWWAGAVTAFVLLFVYAAKEATRRTGSAPRATPQQVPARSRRRQRQGPTDEEWEDLADAAAQPGAGAVVVGGGAVVDDDEPGARRQRDVDE